jgi:hypothetical protein
MARARYFEVATDTNGRPVPSAAVNVYQAGTTTPIAETIYAADSGATTLANPVTANAQGEVEFYLAAPARVDLRWVKAGYTTESHPADVFAPAGEQSGASVAAVKRARYKQDSGTALAVDPEWFEFSWAHFSGDEGILDLTDPQAPTAVEDGLYTVTLSAYAEGLGAAEFLFVEADAGGASSSSSFPIGPAGLTPGGTVSVAYFVAAGESFLAAIQHDHPTALSCGMSAYVTFLPATAAP